MEEKGRERGCLSWRFSSIQQQVCPALMSVAAACVCCEGGEEELVEKPGTANHLHHFNPCFCPPPPSLISMIECPPPSLVCYLPGSVCMHSFSKPTTHLLLSLSPQSRHCLWALLAARLASLPTSEELEVVALSHSRLFHLLRGRKAASHLRWFPHQPPPVP